MGDKTNGSLPKTVQLTREERLEAQMLNLQRDNINLQAQQQLQRVDGLMTRLVTGINERLGCGVDIQRYQINYETGVGTLMTDAPQQQLEGLPQAPPPAQQVS